ncbi:hypothetical protein GOODEAATRI_006183 [Goodea atripinnis]|uniref:Transmembrane protein n=1 Tax=Goodea atripinnis TaxID=208336 RepID=A0ABV0P3T9_9TELE
MGRKNRHSSVYSAHWVVLSHLPLLRFPPVTFFLFPVALICRPYCSKPNPPLAFHSLLSTSPHFDSLRLLFPIAASSHLSFSLALLFIYLSVSALIPHSV